MTINVRTIAFALGSAAALAFASAAAAAELAGDAVRGHAYAKAQCAQCHAIEPGATSSLVYNAAPFAALAASPQLTVKGINAWVMAAHQTKRKPAIPAANCADIVAYIKSLALKPAPALDGGAANP